MISLFVAVIFCIIAFIKFNIMYAILGSMFFIGSAFTMNYCLKPKIENIKLLDLDYVLQDEFILDKFIDGAYVKEVKSKTGKDLVLFKSKGKNDLKVCIRRLPRENVRLIYSDVNVIKLYVAKKRVYGEILYSIFPERVIALGAEIYTRDEKYKDNSDKTYHN